MRRLAFRLSAGLALVLLISIPASATTVLELNLEEMVSRSGDIFRGTIEDFRTGTIEVGGGTLPTVTYVVRIDEILKGASSDKPRTTIEFTMIGTVKEQASPVDGMARFSPLPELPEYEIGRDYLILLTPESSIGLRTSVGLAQGSFVIFNQDHEEVALNGLGNTNLGSGLSGPVRYEDLAAMIRGLVAGGE